MLGIDDLRRVLSECTYRTGWSFSIYEHPFEGYHLRILAPVEDSYHPGQTIDLGINSPIPPMHSEQAFEQWLAWRLNRIESHEAREWFRRTAYEG